jgi:hypothetical protein
VTADLFKALGLDHLSDQAKQEMTEQIGETVFNGVVQRSIPLLSRKQKKAYEKLARTDEAEAYALLQRCLPSLSTIEREETQRVTSELVEMQAEVMKKLGRG